MTQGILILIAGLIWFVSALAAAYRCDPRGSALALALCMGFMIAGFALIAVQS